MLQFQYKYHKNRRGQLMKKKSRIELAREIVACVKRGMTALRVTEPVRNELSGKAKLEPLTARGAR